MSQATKENIQLPGILRIKLIRLDLVHFKIMHNKWITSQQNVENSNNIIPNPFCVINLIDLRQHVKQFKIETFQTGRIKHVQQSLHGQKNKGEEVEQNIGRYTI